MPWLRFAVPRSSIQRDAIGDAAATIMQATLTWCSATQRAAGVKGERGASAPRGPAFAGLRSISGSSGSAAVIGRAKKHAPQC